jgi:DNA-binding transcriptional MerR regulator
MKNFSIGTLSSLTGIPVTTLRSWEQRYGLLAPARTASGHRRYTQHDVDTVQQVIQLLDEHKTIGRALQQLNSRKRTADTAHRQHYVERFLHGVHHYDSRLMDTVFESVVTMYDVSALVEHFISPVFDRLGNQWQDWSGGIAAEHFASNYLRNKTALLIHQQGQKQRGSVFIAACLPGEQHELGLLLFCLAAAGQGLRPLYLGADLPLDQLTSVLESSQGKALVLSGKVLSKTNLRNLRQLAGWAQQRQLPLFLGGAASRQYESRQALDPVILLGCEFDEAVFKLKQQLSGQRLPMVQRNKSLT